MQKITSPVLLLAGAFLLLGGAQLSACPTETEVRNFFLNTPNVLKKPLDMELQSAHGTYKITDFDPPNSSGDYQVERDIPQGAAQLPTTGTTTADAACKYNLSPATLATAGKFGAYVVFERK